MNSEAKNAIDLWVLDSSSLQLGDLTRDYADLLSAVETERLAGYSLARSKGQFLLSRALLRQVLGHYVFIKDFEFELGEYGRPQLRRKGGNPSLSQSGSDAGLDTLSFNLSHSRERFVVAVSRAGVVGVDVEYSARSRRVERLMTRYFSPAEQAALMALPAPLRQARFYTLWTLKESYIKAKGMGLALPLADFSFDIAPQGEPLGIAFSGSLDNESPVPWRFCRSEAAGEDYALALALEAQGGGAIETRVRVASGGLAQWSDFSRSD